MGPGNTLHFSANKLVQMQHIYYAKHTIKLEGPMAVSFVKSRAKRFEIGRLLGEGYTLEQAEGIVLKGDSNRSRLVKAWRDGGVYPYGGKDKPTGDSFLDDAGALQIDSAAYTKEPLQAANTAHTEAHIQTASAVQINWNDPVLTEKLRALIREALEEQSTAIQTAHAQIKPSRKLWRTSKNVSPVCFRLQTELMRRARVKLQETYQGQMSLNHYIELTLWRLVGEPEDLLEPEI